MSEAVAAHAEFEAYETPLTPESWGKLGMWVFLAGDAMSFGTLLAAYGAVRFGSGDWPVPVEAFGGVTLSSLMTFLLICSSVSMVWGLAAAQQNDLAGFRKWIFMTILGGALFLAGQAYEWTHFLHAGLGFTGNPYGSPLFGTTFYVITGFHGMHVSGGVIYLLIVLIKGWNGHFTGENASPVEILGLYWHFVDLVWIMVFTFIYLI
ncbi:MAG: cytochrome c oxidase subunit 3 [Candidatus Tectomicrobia bacterium]|nr:cytochrome c oxidase subunit 3 [Candidatus Tectomicrobia bacterium]